MWLELSLESGSIYNLMLTSDHWERHTSQNFLKFDLSRGRILLLYHPPREMERLKGITILPWTDFATLGVAEYNMHTHLYMCYMDVSENSVTPKSSILIGFSIINHPFWGTPIFGNTHVLYTIYMYMFIIVNRYYTARYTWPVSQCTRLVPLRHHEHSNKFKWMYCESRFSKRKQIRIVTHPTSNHSNHNSIGRKTWKRNKVVWFQIFFIFTPIWGRFPFWLIFFKGVETTNQETNDKKTWLSHWLLRRFFSGDACTNRTAFAHLTCEPSGAVQGCQCGWIERILRPWISKRVLHCNM